MAGTYGVRLNCQSGSKATTTLTVLTVAMLATIGPHTGGGYLAGDRPGANPQTRATAADGSARTWLISGLTTLLAAGWLTLVALRRRRRPALIRTPLSR